MRLLYAYAPNEFTLQTHKRILNLNRTSGKKLLKESVNKRIRNSI